MRDSISESLSEPGLGDKLFLFDGNRPRVFRELEPG